VLDLISTKLEAASSFVHRSKKAGSGPSLQARILIDGVPKQTFVQVEKDSTPSILRQARMTFKETLM
jgi:hypothetical protein